jgi:hypothetical protein
MPGSRRHCWLKHTVTACKINKASRLIGFRSSYSRLSKVSKSCTPFSSLRLCRWGIIRVVHILTFPLPHNTTVIGVRRGQDIQALIGSITVCARGELLSRPICL